MFISSLNYVMLKAHDLVNAKQDEVDEIVPKVIPVGGYPTEVEVACSAHVREVAMPDENIWLVLVDPLEDFLIGLGSLEA